MVFTDVVLVVRHRSVSFSFENKKQWKKKNTKQNITAEQMEITFIGLPAKQKEHCFTKCFFSAIPHPRSFIPLRAEYHSRDLRGISVSCPAYMRRRRTERLIVPVVIRKRFWLNKLRAFYLQLTDTTSICAKGYTSHTIKSGISEMQDLEKTFILYTVSEQAYIWPLRKFHKNK